MTINTKRVSGRRAVRYASLDEVVTDAVRLAAGRVRTLGNWSPGQIFGHLAQSLDASIDGMGLRLPAPMRLLLTWFMKKKYLTQGLPAGFQAPGSFVPRETSSAEGLAALRRAVERQRTETRRAEHPAFGQLSRAEWEAFHLRHAELHMSFLQEAPLSDPAEGPRASVPVASA